MTILERRASWKVGVYFVCVILALLLAGCGVTSEQQAKTVFEKHRAWFEYAVRQIAASREIKSIEPAGDFFDREVKVALSPEDLSIYLDLQAGMKNARVWRIRVADVGRGQKAAVSFVLDNEFTNPWEILAVSAGYSFENFVSHHAECRPLPDSRWYVCSDNPSK